MSANGIRNPLASILTYIAHNVGFRFHSCRGRKSRPKQTSWKLPQKRLSLWCARLTASLKFPRENSGIIRPTLLKSDTSILGAYADILPGRFSTAGRTRTVSSSRHCRTAHGAGSKSYPNLWIFFVKTAVPTIKIKPSTRCTGCRLFGHLRPDLQGRLLPRKLQERSSETENVRQPP